MMKAATAFLTLLTLFGCPAPGSGTGAIPSEETGSRQKELELTGRVVKVPLEGGFFGIVAHDGRRYDPVNLPEEYRRDGITVRLKARPLPGSVGFHMWGERIEITEIEMAP